MIRSLKVPSRQRRMRRELLKPLHHHNKHSHIVLYFEYIWGVK
jgi:hypothetical protein